MKNLRCLHRHLPVGVAFCALMAANPSLAQEASQEEVSPNTENPETAKSDTAKASSPIADGKADTVIASKTTYTPEDFKQFAPKNALDMLRQVPSFSIRQRDQGRGLGQATDNVLIDGKRFASKSDDVSDQLARISADRVVRIEIVDGASLDIPGLSGQVANIITGSQDGIDGQFTWRTQFRPHYAYPNWYGGEISLNGTKGRLSYTASLSNQNGRGAAGGPTLVYDGLDQLIETQDTVLRIRNDNPKLAGSLKWDGPSNVTANLNLSYRRGYLNVEDDERRTRPGGDDRTRDYDQRERGYDYEIGGDIAFPLGPGSLKLIGLERYEHSDYSERLVTVYDDMSPDTGSRYAQTSNAGERIARGEYNWPMLGGEWQLSAEAAFNRFDRAARVFSLDSDGDFEEIPFPQGTGGVNEDRYESILTHSRALTPKLSVQIGAGGEYSKLTQSGPGGLTREFWRPKGSLSLAWAPEKGLDLSAKVERRVGQLSFGDFLARVFIDDDNENASNAELVPEQYWQGEVEAKKSLGRWGSANLRVYSRLYDDYIDIIPLPGGGEARGNIDSATLYGVQFNGTVKFDAIGWKGAKLDFTSEFETSNIRDPLTGRDRALSFHNDRSAEVDFRYDVPKSDWALGGGFEYNHNQPYYRLYETGLQYEGPIYSYLFVEHKDVLGMTVSANLFNWNNGRRIMERTVYDGPRDSSPVAFREDTDQLIGPIFSFTVKGNV